MRLGSLLLLFFFFTACSSGPVPNAFLQPERMQKIVYDLIRVDEFLNNFGFKDSTVDMKKKRSTLYEQVFKVHNTTRKEFYTSLKYYQQHPDVQKALFDSLHQSVNKKVEPGKLKPGNLIQ